MTSLDAKYDSTIDEGIAHLVTRASDARGLSAEDLRPRVVSAIEKYILQGPAGHPEIRTFIDEIRADDLCLIIACERGDEKAWEDLVAHFDSTVKSAARKISANAEDADDLASSIWAELYGLRQDADGHKKSKLSYYSGRGSLAGWLRAVVSQLAVDQYRKQAKFVQVEEARDFENLANEASGPSSNHLVSHTDTPEEIFSDAQSANDVSEALASAIDALEPEDRLILKLYYFDDLRLKEIAAAFGFHEATASRKLARIQADIRRSVELALRAHHGWGENEVKRYLADTAAKLGINLEQLFSALIVLGLVQEYAARGVL